MFCSNNRVSKFGLCTVSIGLSSKNSQIAHWCRYLKEACMFYGQSMKNKTFYTGLNPKLLFKSLKQHFECPISTTTEISVAEQFCDGDGIILKLKAEFMFKQKNLS